MAVTTAPQKLSRMTKFAFGAGDLGPAIVTFIKGFYLFPFLINVALLSPSAAGLVLLIVTLWDAVNDPIIGTLTDRTRSRWGRRRPWLLFGAIPFGLAYFLLWLVPPFDDTGRFIYYVLIGILLDAFYSAVNVPYTALTPELTSDYNERTSLNSYRFGFSILGAVIAAAIHSQILAAFEDKVLGYAISAGIWAFFIAAPNFLTFAFTRETHIPPEGEKTPGFFQGLAIALGNRAFRWVVAIYFLSWLAIQFVQNNLILYIVAWANAEAWITQLLLAIQIANFIFLVMWARVSQRLGKQRVYYIGMTFWIFVSMALFFVQPGQILLLFVLAILAGVGLSLGYLIPWSMIPDVVEMDELETGQRREGVYYGFFVFLQKIGLSIGLAISGFVLDWSGYIRPAVEGDPIPPQPDSALLTLRIFVSFVPAAILLLSFIAVRAYPITSEKHAEMLAELAKRKAQSVT